MDMIDEMPYQSKTFKFDLFFLGLDKVLLGKDIDSFAWAVTLRLQKKQQKKQLQKEVHMGGNIRVPYIL